MLPSSVYLIRFVVLVLASSISSALPFSSLSSASSSQFRSSSTDPPPSSQLPPQTPTWLAVERVAPSPDGEGDAVLIRPEHCGRACADVLGTTGAMAIPRARCVCRCPADAPMFVQSAEGMGKCTQKAPDCPGRTIRFDRSSDHSEFAPTLSIPRHGDALASELRIAWKDSGIKARPGQGPRCTLQSAYSLSEQSNWRPLDGDLFKLGWMNGDGRVIWTGNGKDAEELAGGIVQLVLECAAGKSGNGSFCVAFRVEGQIESRFGLKDEDGGNAGADVGVEVPSRRAEVVAIILLAILLFLSLFGSIFLWNICWRMEKRKLVHSLQVQFLHYAKQEKEKAIADCQLRYQALVKAAAGIHQQQQGGPTPGSPHIGALSNGFLGNGMGMESPQQRRKLYFSAEFFEPHLMINPPPMAEQFLYDLRKMIAVARERIRARKHVPRLHAIVESEDESTSAAGGNRAVQQVEAGQNQKQQQTLPTLKHDQKQTHGNGKIEEADRKSEKAGSSGIYSEPKIRCLPGTEHRLVGAKMEQQPMEPKEVISQKANELEQKEAINRKAEELERKEVKWKDEELVRKEDSRKTEEMPGKPKKQMEVSWKSDELGRKEVGRKNDKADEVSRKAEELKRMEVPRKVDRADEVSRKAEEELERKEVNPPKVNDAIRRASSKEEREFGDSTKFTAVKREEVNSAPKCENSSEDELWTDREPEEVIQGVDEEDEEVMKHMMEVDEPMEWKMPADSLSFENLRSRREEEDNDELREAKDADQSADHRKVTEEQSPPKSNTQATEEGETEEGPFKDKAAHSVNIGTKVPVPGSVPTLRLHPQSNHRQLQQPQPPATTSRIPIGTASTSSKSARTSNLIRPSVVAATSNARLNAAPPPPLPARPPPSESDVASSAVVQQNNHPLNNQQKGSITGIQRPTNGFGSLASMKRRVELTSGCGGTGDNSNCIEGLPKAKSRLSSLTVGALPSSIPCPTTGPTPSSTSTYVVSPPSYANDHHLKKSLPRRKKAIVPSTYSSSGSANNNSGSVAATTTSNLKMPTMV